MSLMHKNVVKCTMLYTCCKTITITSSTVPFFSDCSLCLTIDVVVRTCNRSILPYPQPYSRSKWSPTLSVCYATSEVSVSSISLNDLCHRVVFKGFHSAQRSFHGSYSILMVREVIILPATVYLANRFLNRFLPNRIPYPSSSLLVDGWSTTFFVPSFLLAGFRSISACNSRYRNPAHFRPRLEPINSLSITVHYWVRMGRLILGWD